MKTSYAAIIGVVLLAIAPLKVFAENPLRVEASIGSEHAVPTVKFTVTNQSNSSIVVYTADLPWGNRRSVYVTAITKKSQTPLEPISPIDDAGPQQTVIKPGEKLQGSISLNEYLKDLTGVSQANDIVVFWFYEPVTKDAKPLGDYGGWLILPKA